MLQVFRFKVSIFLAFDILSLYAQVVGFWVNMLTSKNWFLELLFVQKKIFVTFYQKSGEGFKT